MEQIILPREEGLARKRRVFGLLNTLVTSFLNEEHKNVRWRYIIGCQIFWSEFKALPNFDGVDVTNA